jgi:hypothetical protein
MCRYFCGACAREDKNVEIRHNVLDIWQTSRYRRYCLQVALHQCPCGSTGIGRFWLTPVAVSPTVHSSVSWNVLCARLLYRSVGPGLGGGGGLVAMAL